jgi:hypothetical protein
MIVYSDHLNKYYCYLKSSEESFSKDETGLDSCSHFLSTKFRDKKVLNSTSSKKQMDAIGNTNIQESKDEIVVLYAPDLFVNDKNQNVKSLIVYLRKKELNCTLLQLRRNVNRIESQLQCRSRLKKNISVQDEVFIH